MPRRIGEIEHGIAAAAELDALIDSGEEAAAPAGVAAAGTFLAGTEDDEGRQVFRLAAQTIGDPSAHAGTAELHGAGVHQQLAGRVVEGVGDHRFHDGDVVDDLGEVRQQFGDFGAALAVLFELEFRAEQLGIGIDERGAIAFQEFGRRKSAVEFGELRLVVEKFKMAGRAGHEEEDDVLRLGGKRRFLGRERIASGRIGQAGFGEQIGERHAADTDAAFFKEPAARDFGGVETFPDVILTVHKFSPLFFRNCFVKVQQNARDDRPGGGLRRSNAIGQSGRFGGIIGGELPRIALAIGIAGFFFLAGAIRGRLLPCYRACARHSGGRRR